jgi:hypothetical protein
MQDAGISLLERRRAYRHFLDRILAKDVPNRTVWFGSVLDVNHKLEHRPISHGQDATDTLDFQKTVGGRYAELAEEQLDDRDTTELLLDLIRRATRDDSTMIDEGQLITKQVGFEHVVGREQDCLPLLHEQRDVVADFLGADRVWLRAAK